MIATVIQTVAAVIQAAAAILFFKTVRGRHGAFRLSGSDPRPAPLLARQNLPAAGRFPPRRTRRKGCGSQARPASRIATRRFQPHGLNNGHSKPMGW
jgi:hypothetical protein